MATRKAKPREKKPSPPLPPLPPRSVLPALDTETMNVVDAATAAAAAAASAASSTERVTVPSVRPKPADDDDDDVVDTTDADEKEKDARPSSTMTREMPAVAVEALLAGSASATGSNPMIAVAEAASVAAEKPAAAAVAPPAPPTVRVLDDLAITIEAPAAPRLAILDAADAHVRQVGFADASEDEIARRANVSIDVFRALFNNKQALLQAMTDRFCDQVISVTNDSTQSGIWDRARPQDVIEVGVRSILEVVLNHAALVRAVLLSGDQRLIDGFRRVGSNITTRVMRAIANMQQTPQPSVEDVAFVFLIAISLAHHTIMVGPQWSGVAFDREELYDRATRTAMAYLDATIRGTAAAGADASANEIADAPST